jgi:hypothetical protein
LPVKTVNMKDFAKELKVTSKKERENFRHATIAGIVKSIPDLVAASPVDTGLYAQSWDFTETETAIILGNSAPHAAIIEYGARPHTPPIGALLAWAHRVLNGSGADRGQPLTAAEAKSSGNSPLSGYSHQEWALAKSVQKKIAERGQEPKHVLENAIPGIIQNIREEYASIKR